MTVMSAARYPLSVSVATLITALLFLALDRLTAPMEYVPPTKSVAIDFHQVRPDTPPVTRQTIEKPVRPSVPTIGDGRGIALPDTDKVTPEKRSVPGQLAPPATVIDNLTPLVGGSDRDAGPLVRVNPQYPQRALLLGTQGWVQLRYTITATGAVTDVRVIASEPRGVFEEVAITAVSRWRYQPKVMDGAAVERPGVETLLRFELQKP